MTQIKKISTPDSRNSDATTNKNLKVKKPKTYNDLNNMEKINNTTMISNKSNNNVNTKSKFYSKLQLLYMHAQNKSSNKKHNFKYFLSEGYYKIIAVNKDQYQADANVIWKPLNASPDTPGIPLNVVLNPLHYKCTTGLKEIPVTELTGAIIKIYNCYCKQEEWEGVQSNKLMITWDIVGVADDNDIFITPAIVPINQNTDNDSEEGQITAHITNQSEIDDIMNQKPNFQ
jgi:hypothetical protein